MKNRINRFFLSFRNNHGANSLSFFKKWGDFTQRYLTRKPIRTALFYQPVLGLILTLTIALCIGRQGTLPEAFSELLSIKAYMFLLCFGASLVLLPMLLPFRSLHCIKQVGHEAMRFAMGGASLVIGLLAGMFLIFIESGDYQHLWICIVGAALMVIMVIYCAFGLTLYKTCERIEPKPGRRWWQAGALACAIFLTYWSCQ